MKGLYFAATKNPAIDSKHVIPAFIGPLHAHSHTVCLESDIKEIGGLFVLLQAIIRFATGKKKKKTFNFDQWEEGSDIYRLVCWLSSHEMFPLSVKHDPLPSSSSASVAEPAAFTGAGNRKKDKS